MNLGKNNCYQLPLFPILPAIYMVGITVLVLLRAYYETSASVQDLLFVISGIPVYFLFFKNNSTN